MSNGFGEWLHSTGPREKRRDPLKKKKKKKKKKNGQKFDRPVKPLFFVELNNF